jgi:hypothetical protein
MTRVALLTLSSRRNASVSARAPLFGAEIDAVWEARDRGGAPVMSPRDSVATMRSLDRWPLGVGVR